MLCLQLPKWQKKTKTMIEQTMTAAQSAGSPCLQPLPVYHLAYLCTGRTEIKLKAIFDFIFTALFTVFIFPATGNSPVFDFRADCKHHPANWRQQWPHTVWPRSVRSTKKQPHPLSLWPPASKRESILRPQGAGQWIETRSYLQSAAPALDLPWTGTLYTTFHLFSCCYTLTLSLLLWIMTSYWTKWVYKSLVFSFEVQLLFFTAICKLRWSLRRSFHVWEVRSEYALNEAYVVWPMLMAKVFLLVLNGHTQRPDENPVVIASFWLPPRSLQELCVLCLSCSLSAKNCTNDNNTHIQMVAKHS